MSFFGWLSEKLGNKNIPLNIDSFCIDKYAEELGDIYIRELAFWSAVDLIAAAVSKCEFKTYLDGKETKGAEYYLWNFEPNKNQNASDFIHKWIAKLYRDNECLIVEQNGQLLIADSFSRKAYALYDDVFTQVTVEDFTFSRSFSQADVLYFKLSEQNMRQLVSSMYASYSKLLSYSMSAYQRSRGTKGIFKYEALPMAGTEERKIFDTLVNDKIKAWLTGDNAALPLGKGQDFKELEKKTYSSESTRDIRALVDDVFDFTARALNIPPVLLTGSVQNTNDAVDQFLTFGIDPLTKRLSREINRKRSGYEGLSRGTYLQIDTKAVKHTDLLSVSSAIDKLISSGAFSINDIRDLVGEPAINEPWANDHFITKNYSLVNEAASPLNGS